MVSTGKTEITTDIIFSAQTITIKAVGKNGEYNQVPKKDDNGKTVTDESW